MTSGVRVWCGRASRIVTGLVLVAAPVMKFLSFHQFAQSVIRFGGLPGAAGAPLAAIIMLVELGIGVLLLRGRRVLPAARTASLLFLVFAIVLGIAAARGVDTPCNCFGTPGPSLPPASQAGVDLLLAGIAFLASGCALPAGAEHPRWYVIAGGLLLSTNVALMVRVAYAVPAHEGPAAALPIEYYEPLPARPSVTILADFDDFGCQLCLDDFLAFCDSVNGEPYCSGAAVRLIARRDTTRSVAGQERMLQGWASGNGYRFPVSVDIDGFFEQSGAAKTSAFVWDGEGRLAHVVTFPLGTLKRLEVLRSLRR